MLPKLNIAEPRVEYKKALLMSTFLMCLRVNKYHKLPKREFMSRAFEMLIEFLPKSLSKFIIAKQRKLYTQIKATKLEENNYCEKRPGARYFVDCRAKLTFETVGMVLFMISSLFEFFICAKSCEARCFTRK